MLKKQTVWLLTMLSLLIVLSVYYIMSPNGSELVSIDQENNDDNAEVDGTADYVDGGDQDEAEITDITNGMHDELFASLRMELQDKRSMEKSRLESIVASSTASVEEEDSALQGIDAIDSLETTEKVIEQRIISQQGYEDILVRNTSGDKVHVHVPVDELTPDEALVIMQMVRDEFNEDITVDVNYQPVIAK